MKVLIRCGIILLLAVGTSTILPGQTAKEDVQSGRLPQHKAKDTGKDGKKTAKNTGHKVQKGGKKAANKAAGQTKHSAHRAKQETQSK